MCSLGGTSCQILAPNYNSREIPLTAMHMPQAWPSCLIGGQDARPLQGASEGTFVLLSGPLTLACGACSVLLSVSGTLRLSQVLTQSTDCLTLIPIKSLISISFLSLLENMCPEEAEILYRLESYPRTVNPHAALVK